MIEPPQQIPSPPAAARSTETQVNPPSGSVASICWMICAAGLALVAGRIAVVHSQTGEVPFLSANDRSRWATVASLVDYRTYAIDRLQNYRDPASKRRTWQTIDRVQHRDGEGRLRSYSSKPPLLATLVAGPYAALKTVTGWSIQEHPFLVGRLLLAIVNLPLLGLLLACVSGLTLRRCNSAWGAIFLTLAASLGTLLTPFAISLNNHLPGAAAVAATLWLLDRQSRTGPRWWAMFAAGIAIAFAVTNELPALAIVPLWGLVGLRIGWRETLSGLVPGMLVVAALFFGTNWLAHASLRIPYAHRDAGAVVDSFPVPPETADIAAALPEIARRLDRAPEDLVLAPSRVAGRLRLDGPDHTWALDLRDGRLEIRQWDDWYDYPGTYWSLSGRRGVDLGERSLPRYAFHALLGHHGIFSLTPLWLLSLAGAALGLAQSPQWGSWRRDARPQGDESQTAEYPYFPAYEFWSVALICLVTAVCTYFYLTRPLIDRNYGGVSAGFRWLLWMAPLWLYLAVPAVNRLAGHRRGRLVCLVFLIISLFSVSTALENPWRHPWIYRWMDDLGWIANETDG